MNNNISYHQNKQSQLNAYKSDLSNLKALTARTNETIQKEMSQHFRWIGFMIDEVKSILIDFQNATSKTWVYIQLGIESALATLQDSINDARSELKLEMTTSCYF